MNTSMQVATDCPGRLAGSLRISRCGNLRAGQWCWGCSVLHHQWSSTGGGNGGGGGDGALDQAQTPIRWKGIDFG